MQGKIRILILSIFLLTGGGTTFSYLSYRNTVNDKGRDKIRISMTIGIITSAVCLLSLGLSTYDITSNFYPLIFLALSCLGNVPAGIICLLGYLELKDKENWEDINKDFEGIMILSICLYFAASVFGLITIYSLLSTTVVYDDGEFILIDKENLSSVPEYSDRQIQFSGNPPPPRDGDGDGGAVARSDAMIPEARMQEIMNNLESQVRNKTVPERFRLDSIGELSAEDLRKSLSDENGNVSLDAVNSLVQTGASASPARTASYLSGRESSFGSDKKTETTFMSVSSGSRYPTRSSTQRSINAVNDSKDRAETAEEAMACEMSVERPPLYGNRNDTELIAPNTGISLYGNAPVLPQRNFFQRTFGRVFGDEQRDRRNARWGTDEMSLPSSALH